MTTNIWQSWLDNISVDEQKNLYETLNVRFSTKDEVIITRTPCADLLVNKVPFYLDIFNLHPLYEKVAFSSNLLLKGPKGDGKSLSIYSYAEARKIPIVVQECSENTKETHLLGSQTLLGDRTVFVLGAIPTAIDVANEYGTCILLFEEINALTPQVQKSLNAIGDFRRSCSMSILKKTYRLDQGKLWVVGTMNPSVYGGTYELNEDLKSRFEELEVNYPEFGPEKKVLSALTNNTVDGELLNKIIRLGKETRTGQFSYKLSTRDLSRLVDTINKTDISTALQLLTCKFEGDDRENIIKRIGSIFGDLGIKPYWE